MTQRYNQQEAPSVSIEDECLEMTAYLMGAGLDVEQACVFVQSQVPEICELQWILACLGPMHWLNNMTQYKEKKGKGSSLGLFGYPALMAADILAFRADGVPVGDDQTQHLELTRKYAARFNSMFETPYFPEVAHIVPKARRVMSLRDGSKKMSKSEVSDLSRLNLKDSPE